jgi:hypothetical protein
MRKILVKCTGVFGWAALSMACAAEPEVTESVPESTLDRLEEQDIGGGYNGWTQGVFAFSEGSSIYVEHTLSRSSGDTTRGGGACFVVAAPSVSCSDDSTCVSYATSAYGSSAYGYCYLGQCYSRPGSQADFCVMNPNRTAGTLSRTSYGSFNPMDSYVVGCMTKTAGPNTACGGTNPGLYMRTLLMSAF